MRKAKFQIPKGVSLHLRCHFDLPTKASIDYKSYKLSSAPLYHFIVVFTLFRIVLLRFFGALFLKVSELNKEYKLCSSYPACVVMPRRMPDQVPETL